MSDCNLEKDKEILFTEIEKIRLQVERSGARFENLQKLLAELRVEIAKLHRILHP